MEVYEAMRERYAETRAGRNGARVTLARVSIRGMLLGGLVAIGAMLSSAAPAAGQDATPAADFVTPDPAACTVEARAFEEVVALAATPAAATPPVTMPVASPIAAGEPADAETVQAVTETVAELYACLEADEPLRAYALFSDGALRQLLAEDLLQPEGVIQGLGPREAFRIEEVRTLPDDRAAAVIAFRVSEGAFTETWSFVRVDDHYLVEGLITSPLLDAEATPQA
jgi:hypothetical protein